MPEFWEYPKRTEQQHNTEWLYYQIMAKASGHTAYEIYENMAMRILKVVDEDGDIGFVKPSCLNTMHHNLYLEQVRMVAAEFDIWLPDPETNVNLQYTVKKRKELFKSGRK